MTCDHKDAFWLDGKHVCLDCTMLCAHSRRVIVSLDPYFTITSTARRASPIDIAASDTHLVEECADCGFRFEPSVKQPPPQPPENPRAPAVMDLLSWDLDHLPVTPSMREMIRFDLAARDAAGQKTYGTRLYPGNGRDSLMDAYEEALDLAAYLRQHRAEHGGGGGVYYKALHLMTEIRELLYARDGR